MNKKLLATLLMIAPIVIYAEDSPTPSTMRGIQIVPMAKQSLPTEMKSEIASKTAEEARNGYQLRYDDNAKYLLNIKRNASQELRLAKEKNYGVYDTHLKSNYTAIKLAFPFKGIKSIPTKDTIGYAAIGNYVKEKNKEGWNGIKVLFETTYGNCAYSHMGILGVQLNEETTEYLVNKKPSNKIIEGNPNSGFVYTLNWYTNDSMNTVECANRDFNKVIMDKMTVLANKIDKDMLL